MSDFATLKLNNEICSHLNSLGFNTPTKVQEKALFDVLAKKDCKIQAKTGSGKTLCFALGALGHLKEKNLTTLILAPTRELVMQIAKEMQSIVRYKENIKVLSLYGGAPIKEQLNSAKHGANIIVATPNRFLRVSELLHVKDISYLVLDEADRLFEMGFEDDIEKIEKLLPKNKQTLFFSATYPESLHIKAKEMLKNAKTITASTCKESINEWLIKTEDKLNSIENALNHYMPKSAIIFCNAKQTCQEVGKELKKRGFKCALMEGEMKQTERIQTIETFTALSTPLLVATEVAARGLDIPKVELVINYDVPRTLQSYTHRIGRTGRHETKGDAITLVSKDSFDMIEKIEKDTLATHPPLHVKGEWKNIKHPTTLCLLAGKDRKLRKGDIVGALINECGLTNEQILTISLHKSKSYISISKNIDKKLLIVKGKKVNLKVIL